LIGVEDIPAVVFVVRDAILIAVIVHDSVAVVVETVAGLGDGSVSITGAQSLLVADFCSGTCAQFIGDHAFGDLPFRQRAAWAEGVVEETALQGCLSFCRYALRAFMSLGTIVVGGACAATEQPFLRSIDNAGGVFSIF